MLPTERCHQAGIANGPGIEEIALDLGRVWKVLPQAQITLAVA